LCTIFPGALKGSSLNVAINFLHGLDSSIKYYKTVFPVIHGNIDFNVICNRLAEFVPNFGLNFAKKSFIGFDRKQSNLFSIHE
jgi:hypothetical protein